MHTLLGMVCIPLHTESVHSSVVLCNAVCRGESTHVLTLLHGVLYRVVEEKYGNMGYGIQPPCVAYSDPSVLALCVW